MLTVKYVEQDYDAVRRPPRYEYGRTASGYGNKIATDIMIRFSGDYRWRRVYCVCWSNVGSLYVVVKGEQLYLREGYLESRLEKTFVQH